MTTGVTAMFADDFVSVQDGVISRPSRDASRDRFERYFPQVNFIARNDLDDPAIEVSDDVTLATVLVHKLVHLTFVGTVPSNGLASRFVEITMASSHPDSVSRHVSAQVKLVISSSGSPSTMSGTGEWRAKPTAAEPTTRCET